MAIRGSTLFIILFAILPWSCTDTGFTGSGKTKLQEEKPASGDATEAPYDKRKT